MHNGAHRTAVIAAAAALALVGLAGAAAPVAATPVPPPVEVEKVETARDELAIQPAVTGVSPDANGDVVVHHRIINGTDLELEIHLEVQGVEPGTVDPDPDVEPAADVILTADRLQLAPQEAARVATVATGVSAGVAYALVASVPAAEPPVRITSTVLAAAGSAEVSIDEPTLSTERLSVRISASQTPVIIDAAVRLRTWTGHEVLDSPEPGLIAWRTDEPTELTYDLEGVTLPGPYYVDVVAAGGDGVVSATHTVWLLLEVTLTAIAVLLLVLTGGSLAFVWLRRRRRDGAAADTSPRDPSPSLPGPTGTDEEQEHG